MVAAPKLTGTKPLPFCPSTNHGRRASLSPWQAASYRDASPAWASILDDTTTQNFMLTMHGSHVLKRACRKSCNASHITCHNTYRTQSIIHACNHTLCCALHSSNILQQNSCCTQAHISCHTQATTHACNHTQCYTLHSRNAVQQTLRLLNRPCMQQTLCASVLQTKSHSNVRPQAHRCGFGGHPAHGKSQIRHCTTRVDHRGPAAPVHLVRLASKYVWPVGVDP